MRAGERLLGGHADGHRYEVLTPPVPGQRAEVSLHTLAPGSATGGPGDPPIHEPGSRETAVVLDGGLRLVCDGVAHDLAEGDAVTFDADLPHHFENPGRAREPVHVGDRRGTEEELIRCPRPCSRRSGRRTRCARPSARAARR